MNIVKKFKQVRDIPYRIPLSPSEPDDCCSGKSIRLLSILKDAGYDARYRICTFLWSSIQLPNEVKSVSHDNNSSHQFLEVKIGKNWRIVDPTWDKGLKSIFTINAWNGKSNTEIAIPVQKLLSPEESVRYIKKVSTEEAVLRDLKKNREFYNAFNDWLNKTRKQSII